MAQWMANTGCGCCAFKAKMKMVVIIALLLWFIDSIGIDYTTGNMLPDVTIAGLNGGSIIRCAL